MVEFAKLVVNIYTAVRWVWHLAWLRFNLWLKQNPVFIHDRSPYFHKIAIIGDGLAEGLGDHLDLFTAAGLARHLTLSFSKHPGTFRQRWQVRREAASSSILPHPPAFVVHPPPPPPTRPPDRTPY